MVGSTSWKGHSFTLMVFLGIVVLCSIFFVLGMLVGHNYAQRLPDKTAAASTIRAASEPSEKESELPPVPVRPIVPDHAINFQLAAVASMKAAERLLSDVRAHGFPASILDPPAGEKNPLYRVQVGPYTDPAAAEAARRKLESAGYKPIVRR